MTARNPHKQCLHRRDLKKKNEHFRLGTAAKLVRVKKSERPMESKKWRMLKTLHNYALELIFRIIKIFYTLLVLIDLVLFKVDRELFTHMFKKKLL